MAIVEEVLKHYLADNPPSVVPLKIKPHFDALSDEEKLYAHFISMYDRLFIKTRPHKDCAETDVFSYSSNDSNLRLHRACFAGTRIALRQCSPEAEAIYDIIIELHNHFDGNWEQVQEDAGLSEDELKNFLSYAAQFLGNCGNYKSFGDSKFIPRLGPQGFEAISALTPKTTQLWKQIKDRVFGNTNVGLMHFGYPDAGHLSMYYPDSPDITKEEITTISNFLESKKFLPENTRIRKTTNGFEVLIASAMEHPTGDQLDIPELEWHLEGKLKGKKLVLTFGDYSKELGTITDAIENAGKHAANDNQITMMQEYSKSFRTGSLQAYKNSQRFWVRDKGPMVESDIGFIETYRDPHGIRAEWRGFAAMVNKERTKVYGKLVNAAPSLIPKLPWNKDFEKDKFLSPDFTSLEVLTFAGRGIPVGINIPNYDDIRQTEGFKNVSLGNVLGAKAPNEKIPFIKDVDLDVYQKHRDNAFEVQIGLHELLGHGCGKLLQETAPGQYNFDIKNPPLNPLTNKPVTSWYKPGQTWGSVFGATASSYEECRAEAVAMALSCDFSVLSIFGFGNGETDINNQAGDVLYAGYLSMARAGIAALEFWDPKARKWGQAHMKARFSILRTFLDAGPEFASLDYNKDDLSDLTIKIDRTKILSIGRPAVEKYLRKLHIYKATADMEGGTKMYNDVTEVGAFFAEKVRPAVIAKKMPRKIFVQANTFVCEDGMVELREYEASPDGLIRSYAERTYI